MKEFRVIPPLRRFAPAKVCEKVYILSREALIDKMILHHWGSSELGERIALYIASAQRKMSDDPLKGQPIKAVLSPQINPGALVQNSITPVFLQQIIQSVLLYASIYYRT